MLWAGFGGGLSCLGFLFLNKKESYTSTFFCCRPEVFLPGAAPLIFPSAYCSWLAFWSSFCFCRLVSTYLSTLLSGTHSSQLEETQRLTNHHSEPSPDCLLHTAVSSKLQRFGTKLCSVSIMDWHDSRSKLPNLPHCLQLE